MVQSCSALNCTTRRRKGNQIKFHKIPKDPCTRANWLYALGRSNFIPAERTFICEKHFTKEDYEINVFGNRVLKKGATPSVFDFAPFSSKSIPLDGTNDTDVEHDINSEQTVEEFKPLDGIKDEISNDEDAEGRLGPEETINDEVELEDQENLELTHDNSIYIDSEVDLYEENVETIKLIVSPNDGVNSNMKSIIANQTNHIFRNRRDPVYFGDFIESDLNDEIKRKRFWKVANLTVSKYRKMNIDCQRRLRAKEQKIQELYAAMDKLFSNQTKPT